jgi:hypothetical protein
MDCTSGGDGFGDFESRFEGRAGSVGLSRPTRSRRVLVLRPIDEKKPPADLGTLRFEDAELTDEKDVWIGGATGRGGALASAGYGRAGSRTLTSLNLTPRSVAKYASARMGKVALDRTELLDTTRACG